MRKLLLVVAPLLWFAAGCTPPTSTGTGPSTTSTPADEAAAAGYLRVGAGNLAKLTSDNTKIMFVGTKPGGKHDGGFKNVSGELQLQAPTPGARGRLAKIGGITIEIETDSLWADDPKLTTHLKSADFFDVNKYPKATFKSSKIEWVGDKDNIEELKVTGDLEFHGVKKTITIPVLVNANRGLWISTTFELSRKEFGMTYGEGKVDDKVTVYAELGKKPA